MTPEYWDKGCKALCKKDKTMAKLIRTYKGEFLATRGDAFYTLARSIVGQQISVKAADSVWKKLEAKYKKITPAIMFKTDVETLRSVGLSQQKANYMLSLAEFFVREQKHLKHWSAMEDEALIKHLTQIKGIGRWTAEMFLIFHMLRPDIFPIADLGMLKAIYKHYNGSKEMPKAKVLKLAEAWKPYRTIATWYLWRSLDPVPVEY